MNIHNYFINPKHHEGLKSFDLINYLSRKKLLIDISIFLSLTVFFIFIYRYFFLHIETLSLGFLLITSIVLLAGLIYIKQTGKISFQAWLLLVLFALVLPLRTYYTGGIIAPNITWFAAGIVIVGALHNKKTSFAYFILAALQLIATHYFKTPEYVTPIPARIIIHLTGFAVIIHSLRSMIKVNKFILNENKKLEQIHTINLMITSLSHEINNPLTIAKGNIYRLRNSADKDILDKVDNSLDRISEVVKKISEINDKGEIDVEPYASGKRPIISLK